MCRALHIRRTCSSDTAPALFRHVPVTLHMTEGGLKFVPIKGSAMSHKRTSTPRVEASIDSTVAAEPAPLQGVLSVPTARPTFQDAIFDKVIDQLDLPGLAQKVATEAAAKLIAQVRVETLVETVMHQEEQTLSARLVERVLDRLALRL